MSLVAEDLANVAMIALEEACDLIARVAIDEISEQGIPIVPWIARDTGLHKDTVHSLAVNGVFSSSYLERVIDLNIGGAAEHAKL